MEALLNRQVPLGGTCSCRRRGNADEIVTASRESGFDTAYAKDGVENGSRVTSEKLSAL
jgi:hypothetical protein